MTQNNLSHFLEKMLHVQRFLPTLKSCGVLLPVLIVLSGCLASPIKPSNHNMSEMRRILVASVESPPLEVIPDLIESRFPVYSQYQYQAMPSYLFLEEKIYQSPGGILIAGLVSKDDVVPVAGMHLTSAPMGIPRSGWRSVLGRGCGVAAMTSSPHYSTGLPWRLPPVKAPSGVPWAGAPAPGPRTIVAIPNANARPSVVLVGGNTIAIGPRATRRAGTSYPWPYDFLSDPRVRPAIVPRWYYCLAGAVSICCTTETNSPIEQGFTR